MEHEDSSDELVTSAQPYPKCRASLAQAKLASGEESPGSLNSRFAWEIQVPVRVRTVPQKRKQLCEACASIILSKRKGSTAKVQRRGKSSPLNP